MAFEVHTDTWDHPAVIAAGLEGWGTFVLLGSWTSANNSPGFVPSEVALEHARPEVAAQLVEAGLWTQEADGYRMQYGPGKALPLPLWRYGDDGPDDGRLLSFVPDPETG